MKKELTRKCPECGSSNVVYNQERDELVCQDCGLIFAELSPPLEKVEESVSKANIPEKTKKAKIKAKR